MGIILDIDSANEGRFYIVSSSLIGCVHGWNDTCMLAYVVNITKTTVYHFPALNLLHTFCNNLYVNIACSFHVIMG